ncbi:MAG: PDZ domain-containing protein [Anaerolineae bacterium]|nr:PDZ domain-containing protein [Anaerolineae bacterium]
MGQLPTPLCLHIRRNEDSTPLPMICNGVMTLRQELADFDVFWYENEQDLTVLVQGGEDEGFCPAGSPYCELNFIPSVDALSDPSASSPGYPTITSSDAPVFNITGNVGAIISQSEVQQLTINVGDSPEETQRKARLRTDTVAAELLQIVRNIDNRLFQVNATLSPDLFGTQLGEIRATVIPDAATPFSDAYQTLFVKQQVSDLRQIFATTAIPNAPSPAFVALASETPVDPFDIQFFYAELNEINIASNYMLERLEKLADAADENEAWVNFQQDYLALEVQTLLNRSQIAYVVALRLLADLKDAYSDMLIPLDMLLFLEPRSLISETDNRQYFDEYLNHSLALATIRAGLVEVGLQFTNADLDAYAAVSAELVIHADDPWNIVVAKAISLRQLGRLTESVAAFAQYGEMFSASDPSAEQYAHVAQQFTLDVRALGILYGAVYIYEVKPDTPAAKAGLSAGDIIVEFDGQDLTGSLLRDGEEITAIEFMQAAMQAVVAGEEVSIVYLLLNEDGTFTRNAITVVKDTEFGFGLMPI